MNHHNMVVNWRNLVGGTLYFMLCDALQESLITSDEIHMNAAMSFEKMLTTLNCSM